MRRLTHLSLFVVLASLPVAAQMAPRSGSPGTSAFGSLEWRNIGPDRGGRSLAAAGSPGRP